VAESIRHIDSVTLRQPERTEEGYIRVEGVVATPGVMTYHRRGETIREYVPPSTLRDEEYLQSLDGKSIVVEHPEGERVGPDNLRMLEVGATFDNRYVDGTGHVATFLIKAPQGIEAYEEGICELSPAYDVTTKEEAGIAPGGARYDLVQVKREAGNHIAMTRAARGGERTAFHADSWTQHADTDEPDTRNAQGDTMPDDKFSLETFGSAVVRIHPDDADKVRRWREDQEDQEGEGEGEPAMELAGEMEQARDQIRDFKSEIDELKSQLERKKAQMRMLKEEMGLGGEPEMSGEEMEDMDYEDMDMPDEGMDGDGMYEDARPMVAKIRQLKSRADSAGDFQERLEERRRVDSLAGQLGVDSPADKDTTALKREVCDAYFDGDQDVDAWGEAELDAQIRVLAKNIEQGAGARDDSLQSATERAANRGDSTDAREAYIQKVVG